MNALPALGYTYAVSGRRTEALRVLAELHEVSRLHRVSPADVAAVYTGLGDRNQAFKWLEKAYQARTSMLLFLNMEPKFDSLRKDSRFDDLVRRISRPGVNASNAVFKAVIHLIYFELLQE